jgi:hypothetical protein
MAKQVMRQYKGKVIKKHHQALEFLLDLDDCFQEPPPNDDIWIGVKGDKSYLINTKTQGDYYDQRLRIINIQEMTKTD